MNLLKYISKLIQNLKNNLFVQNVALVLGGNVSVKIIGILSAPVITRLYTPEDYGIFSIFSSVIAIVGSLSTLRYALTIPLAQNEELSDNLLKLSFIVTITLSLLWVMILILFGDFITERSSISQISQYLWILPLVFLGSGLYQALSNWAIRYKYFKIITRTNISQGISSYGLKIGFGALGVRPLGLLIGLIASQTTGIGRLLFKLIRGNPYFFNHFSWRGILDAAKRFKRFPLIQSWSQLLLALGVQLPVIFIATIYGTDVAGLYGLAHNLINIPMNLLGTSVSQVYYAEIAGYGKSNPDKIYKLSISIVKKMFLMAIIPIIVIIVTGPWVFGLFFGSQWYDAGIYARLLSIIILTRFISSPIASCFNVLEMQGSQLFLNVIRVILIITIFFLSKVIELSAFTAIIIYSISMTIYYLFMMLIVFSALKKQVK